jgi:catechol 2,3-dioxygenase-like lactoylglutathione lyase family enzyme
MAAFLDALVTVYSADIARARRFYGALLGLQEIQVYHRRPV